MVNEVATSARRLVLLEDVIAPDSQPAFLPAAARCTYVREGDVWLTAPGSSRLVRANTAAIETSELQVRAGSEGAVLWRWELVTQEIDPESLHFRSAPEVTSSVKMSLDCPLDVGTNWLMRCDTVTFPPGGVAYQHLHQGPGIRITREGEITIETKGASATYGPGQAWGEDGFLPVYATTTTEVSTTFVRCFILPQLNFGTSSIRIISPEDRARGNTQRYEVLAETVL